MTHINIQEVSNGSNEPHTIVSWCGHRILHLWAIQLSREVFANFPLVYETIEEPTCHILSMTIIGYHMQTFSINILFARPILHDVHFEHLDFEGRPRYRPQTFDDFVASVRRAPDGYVFIHLE